MVSTTSPSVSTPSVDTRKAIPAAESSWTYTARAGGKTGAVGSPLPSTLAVATGSPPTTMPQLVRSTPTSSTSALPASTSQPADNDEHISTPLGHFLIAIGALGAFILVLFLVLATYRVATGSWTGFLGRRGPHAGRGSRRNRGLMIQSPKNWDYKQTFASRSHSNSLDRDRADPACHFGESPMSPNPFAPPPTTLPMPLIPADCTRYTRGRNDVNHQSLDGQHFANFDQPSYPRPGPLSSQPVQRSTREQSTKNAGSAKDHGHRRNQPSQGPVTPPEKTYVPSPDEVEEGSFSRLSSVSSVEEAQATISGPLASPYQPKGRAPREGFSPSQYSPSTAFPKPPSHPRSTKPNRIDSSVEGDSKPIPRPPTARSHDRESTVPSAYGAHRFPNVSNWVENQTKRVQTNAPRPSPEESSAEVISATPMAVTGGEPEAQEDQSIPPETPEQKERREREEEEAAIRRGEERAARREREHIAQQRQQDKAEEERRGSDPTDEKEKENQKAKEKEEEEQKKQQMFRERAERRGASTSTSTATVFRYHPGTAVRFPDDG